MLYNVETIKKSWPASRTRTSTKPCMRRSTFYQDMHAIGPGRKPCKDSMVYATQSRTQAAGSGLSQASQILVQDAGGSKLDFTRFNEAYLMHTPPRRSTRSSPAATWRPR